MEFVTVAWNCAVAPEFTLVVAGETLIVTGAIIEIFAVADLLVSLTLVAVSTAVVFEVTVGAV